MQEKFNLSSTPTALEILEMSESDIWNYFIESFMVARNYHDGIIFISKCISIIDANRDQFPSHRIDDALLDYGNAYLRLLDYADEWDEYKMAAAKMHEYFKEKINSYGRKYFICDYRLDVIERKIQRRNSGKSRKSDYHHSPDALNDFDIKKRLDWLKYRFEFLRPKKND